MQQGFKNEYFLNINISNNNRNTISRKCYNHKKPPAWYLNVNYIESAILNDSSKIHSGFMNYMTLSRLQ